MWFAAQQALPGNVNGSVYQDFGRVAGGSGKYIVRPGQSSRYAIGCFLQVFVGGHGIGVFGSSIKCIAENQEMRPHPFLPTEDCLLTKTRKHRIVPNGGCFV